MKNKIFIVLILLSTFFIVYYKALQRKEPQKGEYIMTVFINDDVKDIRTDQFPKQIGDFYVLGKMYKIIWISESEIKLKEYKDKKLHESPEEMNILKEEINAN